MIRPLAGNNRTWLQAILVKDAWKRWDRTDTVVLDATLRRSKSRFLSHSDFSKYSNAFRGLAPVYVQSAREDAAM